MLCATVTATHYFCSTQWTFFEREGGGGLNHSPREGKNAFSIRLMGSYSTVVLFGVPQWCSTRGRQVWQGLKDNQGFRNISESLHMPFYCKVQIPHC